MDKPWVIGQKELVKTPKILEISRWIVVIYSIEIVFCENCKLCDICIYFLIARSRNIYIRW